uniref:Uncharacterized protein n=1 Tax=Arundo donax TaxID=35708 RepID=A0A0A9CUT4_ARUDO
MNKIREAAADAPGTAVDLSDLLAGYTNDIVCRAVLGESHRKEGRNRLFSELTEINVSLLGGFNLEVYFRRMAMADVLLRLVSVMAKKVNRRWNDLYDVLIHEHLHSSKPSGNKEENSADFIQEEYGLNSDNVKAILVLITVTFFLLQIIELFGIRGGQSSLSLIVLCM